MTESMIETPRWFYEDYPGSEEDIANDIYNSILWRMESDLQKSGKLTVKNKDITSIGDAEVAARLEAEAILSAAPHAFKVKDGMERAGMLLLSRIVKKNLHLIGRNEYESIQEYILDRIPQISESGSEYSNITWLLENGIPMLDQLGINFEKELNWQSNWSKIRESIPHMRRMYKEYLSSTGQVDEQLRDAKHELERASRKISKLENETPEFQKSYEEIEKISDNINKLNDIREDVIEKSGEEFKHKFEEVIKVINNPRIPAREVSHTIKQNLGDNNFVIEGVRAEGPNGDSYFLVVVPAMWGTLIETALRTVVNWKSQDPKYIYEKMRASFFPKDRSLIEEDDI